MGFLLDNWKELLILGAAISLPTVGYFSSSSVINWSKPSGYYTQVSLTIENGSPSAALSTSPSEGNLGNSSDYQLIKVGKAASASPTIQSSDLVAEFPLKYLDKHNWWKYCLPKSSKLKKSGSQTTASQQNSTSEQDCVLTWWQKSDDSNSESIFYLLDLMLKFLKLQHQINLISLFHSSSNSQVSSGSSDGDLISKIKTTCNLSNSSTQPAFLSYMFTSSTPISKNCLITPVKVNIKLKTSGSTGQVVAASTDNNSYSIDNLKKGVISGNIEYSLTDYYGKLHDFQLNTGGSSSSVSLTLEPSKKYEFSLESGSSTVSSGKLNFQKLYEKYQNRDLTLEDFKSGQKQ